MAVALRKTDIRSSARNVGEIHGSHRSAVQRLQPTGAGIPVPVDSKPAFPWLHPYRATELMVLTMGEIEVPNQVHGTPNHESNSQRGNLRQHWI